MTATSTTKRRKTYGTARPIKNAPRTTQPNGRHRRRVIQATGARRRDDDTGRRPEGRMSRTKRSAPHRGRGRPSRGVGRRRARVAKSDERPRRPRQSRRRRGCTLPPRPAHMYTSALFRSVRRSVRRPADRYGMSRSCRTHWRRISRETRDRIACVPRAPRRHGSRRACVPDRSKRSRRHSMMTCIYYTLTDAHGTRRML